MVITGKMRGVLQNRDRAANENAVKDYFYQKFPAFMDKYGSGATKARRDWTDLFVVRYFSIIICYTCGYDASFFSNTFEELPVYIAYTIVHRNALRMPVNILLKQWLKQSAMEFLSLNS